MGEEEEGHMPDLAAGPLPQGWPGLHSPIEGSAGMQMFFSFAPSNTGTTSHSRPMNT